MKPLYWTSKRGQESRKICERKIGGLSDLVKVSSEKEREREKKERNRCV